MMTKALRPSATPPPEVKPPETNPPPEVKPPPETKPPEVKPPPETKPPEVKPPEVKKAPESPGHPWAWVPAAGGVVFAGAGTYFYLQAKDKYDMLDTQGSATSPLDGAKLASDGKRNQTLSRVAFGLGAAGVVTSVVLYLLPAKQPPVSPTVAVGPSGGMVGVVGTLP
jgi:hypothetical protein